MVVSRSGPIMDHAGSWAFSRFDAGAAGGARGWHQGAKVSMMTMVPPQHGHGGRWSAGSSPAGSSYAGATSSSSRASARASLRDEPASRP